jgi:hypothetical protein
MALRAACNNTRCLQWARVTGGLVTRGPRAARRYCSLLGRPTRLPSAQPLVSQPAATHLAPYCSLPALRDTETTFVTI